MNKLRYFFMMTFTLLFISGCSQIHDTYDQIVNIGVEQLQSEDESVPVKESIVYIDVDINEVPSIEMLIDEVAKQENYTLSQQLYQEQLDIPRFHEGLEIRLNHVDFYEVSDIHENISSDFSFETQDAGLLLLNVTLINDINSDLYVPINDYVISYPSSMEQSYPSVALYPNLGGNLVEMLAETEGIIEVEEEISGYLIYGLSESLVKAAKKNDYLSLTIPAARIHSDDFMEQVDLPMFIPLSDKLYEQIQENEAFVHDRLTNEWWGNKEVLANVIENQKMIVDDVEVHLERLEVSDFVPHEEYEEVFVNFPNGQVIVSCLFKIDNQSLETLNLNDASSILTINEDEIYDDYLLTSKQSHQELKPEQSAYIVKTFALDRLRYVDVWQDEEQLVSLILPRIDEEDDAFLFEFHVEPNNAMFLDETFDLMTPFKYRQNQNKED